MMNILHMFGSSFETYLQIPVPLLCQFVVEMS